MIIVSLGESCDYQVRYTAAVECKSVMERVGWLVNPRYFIIRVKITKVVLQQPGNNNNNIKIIIFYNNIYGP